MTALLARIDTKSPRGRLADDVAAGVCVSLRDHPLRSSWPELAALEATPQDPGWHAEGDVLIHTEMVLRAFAEQDAASLPSEHARRIVRTACFLHDIAKPQTTIFDAELNRVIAPRHERLGEIAVRNALHGAAWSPSDRRLISVLVGTHHLVKRVVKAADREGAGAALDLLASRVDTRMLWALELADMQGRRCEDQQGQLDIVGLFRMLCEERGVFGQAPSPWITEADAAGVSFVSERARRYALDEAHRRRLSGELRDEWQARALVHELAQREPAEVILTVGVSGSGKSAQIAGLDGSWQRISSDDVRRELFGHETTQGNPTEVHARCRAKLREVLRRSGRAVMDATHLLRDQRATVLALCHQYGAHVTHWVFDVDPEETRRRNQSRERRVPDEVIGRQLGRFEWPGPEEAHAIRVFETQDSAPRGAAPL
ncbi:MAG: AAA family ATPase [Deltaproteobacteria bacterium]|nr:AAA family ATPase [Deltaproteobacteria bacterium]